MAGARAVASGRAMTVLNSYIVQKFGNEEKFQEQLKNKTWSGWEGHWKAFEGLLKVATGLDDASELNEAITIYNNVRMEDKNSADHVDTFLTEYTAARTLMIEQGLLIPGCPKSRARELEDLKKKLEGSNVLRYLMELPEFPSDIDDMDPAMEKSTVLGRIRQWVRARKGSDLAGPSGSSSKADSTIFLKTQLKKVTELLKEKPQDKTLAFDDGKRFRAARATGGQQTQVRPKLVGGGGDCPRCQGTHPECTVCPNQAASAEDGFDVSKYAKEKKPCWYDHMKKGKFCGGYGHVARHHMEVLKEETKKEIEDWKAATPQAAGKGKGKDSKGKS